MSNRFKNIFTMAEDDRIAAAKQAAQADPQADHGHDLVELPDCHCCEKPDCEHEAPQNAAAAALARLRRIERAARQAVKEYSDHGDGNTFENVMVDLARELTPETHSN